MTLPVLVVSWLLLALVPFGWWLATRRRVDVWKALPVPAALLGPDGAVRDQAGPVSEVAFDVAAGLPARGHVIRTRSSDGTPVALAGVRGGALAVALPRDPVADRRDHVLAELGSRLAHDINTPLDALRGHLDLIAHEPVSDTALASVRTCQRELTRLQTTAQDLLAFTRLRAGGGRRARHAAGALAEEAAAALLDRADELGATLTVDVPSERVEVDVAEGDLLRALRNLIGNALAHGLGERRDVLVTVTADADTVTFAVADSGPGLTREDVMRLSEPLTRGEGVTGPGSGLGLAIVSEVLAGHGAALDVGPRDGGGTVLSFTLPRAVT
jgi:signal transduction histidine kinase